MDVASIRIMMVISWIMGSFVGSPCAAEWAACIGVDCGIGHCMVLRIPAVPYRL